MFECIRSFLVLHFVLSLYRQLITKSLNPIGINATFTEKQIEPFVGGHITASFLLIL